jgi:hypothetical protein
VKQMQMQQQTQVLKVSIANICSLVVHSLTLFLGR